MAKKNLLAANLKRPSLKRTVKVTEEKMDEVVQKVADNPPARVQPVIEAKTATAPSTTIAPAAAPTSKTAPVTISKKGRGRPRKNPAGSTLSTRSVHPKEGTKRLTLDIPKALHLKLKYLALERETTMKDYIIEVVARSLK